MKDTRHTAVIINIGWDTDGQEAPELPKEITLDLNIPKAIAEIIFYSMDTDQLIDYLSDEYGFCIEHFTVSVLEK